MAERVAWLHDVMEDCPAYTPEVLLARGVDPEVVRLACIIAHPRGERYLDYVKRVTKEPCLRKVKRADILANLDGAAAPRKVVLYREALAILDAADAATA